MLAIGNGMRYLFRSVYTAVTKSSYHYENLNIITRIFIKFRKTKRLRVTLASKACRKLWPRPLRNCAWTSTKPPIKAPAWEKIKPCMEMHPYTHTHTTAHRRHADRRKLGWRALSAAEYKAAWTVHHAEGEGGARRDGDGARAEKKRQGTTCVACGG